MKKTLGIAFSLFYIIAKTEVSTASFFLVHESKIPVGLKKSSKTKVAE